jgi:hypothetical protein
MQPAQRLADSASGRSLAGKPGTLERTDLMSPLLPIFVALAAFIGGLLVVYGIGRNKRQSELMLQEYRRLLNEARHEQRPDSPEVEEVAAVDEQT